MRLYNSILVVAGLLVILILFMAPIILSHFPDGSYTEFYFNNHQYLPKNITEDTTLSFTIHNQDTEAHVYLYEVIFNSDIIRRVHKRGVVSISPGQSAVEAFSINEYEFLGMRTPIKVSVRLINTNQEIHFWIS
jgi:hypothetical protein